MWEPQCSSLTYFTGFTLEGPIPVEQCWNVQESETDPSPNLTKKYEQAERECTSRVRHQQVVLSFFGVMVFGLQISSLSLGLVAMSDNDDSTGYPVQNYSLKQKGLMVGMMGYGYSLGNVLLGFISHRFRVISLLPLASGLFSGSMAISVPLAAMHVGFEAVCVAVCLQGLGLSFVYPCVYVHLSKWVVPHEQGKFSWVWSGHQLGHLIVMLTSGVLYAGPGGWPAVFYVPGIIGILWGVAFFMWGVSSPSRHRTICPTEKEYIEKHLKPRARTSSGTELEHRESIKHEKVPWRFITTSVPMWALLIVQISDLWVSESMMGPVFLHSVCRLSVMKVGTTGAVTSFYSSLNFQTGLVTALAYFANITSGLVFAALAHHITDKIGFNFSRKFWTAIGLYGGSLSLLLLTIFGKHCKIATFFLESRIVINSATHPGYMSTILNVAPNLAATIASAFNAIASFVASTGPLYTGLIVKDEYDLFEWDIVFGTGIAVYILGCTTFMIFGSTETQDWDRPYVTTNWGRMSPSSFEDAEFPSNRKERKPLRMKMFGKQKSLQVWKNNSV